MLQEKKNGVDCRLTTAPQPTLYSRFPQPDHNLTWLSRSLGGSRRSSWWKRIEGATGAKRSGRTWWGCWMGPWGSTNRSRRGIEGPQYVPRKRTWCKPVKAMFGRIWLKRVVAKQRRKWWKFSASPWLCSKVRWSRCSREWAARRWRWQRPPPKTIQVGRASTRGCTGSARPEALSTTMVWSVESNVREGEV